MGPLDLFTDAELEQFTDRAYNACIAYFDALDARSDCWAADWKLMRAAATEQAELHRELVAELSRRTMERAEIRASLADQLTDVLLGETDA